MTFARIEEIKWDTAGRDKGAAGFFYVVVNIWSSRADFAARKSPAERQDFRMQLPPKNAVESVPRLINGLYQLIGGGQWTQAEFSAQSLAWRTGKRKDDPRSEIIHDIVSVSHSAVIEANITRYLARWKLAPTTGDKRDPTLSLTARDEPGGIVDKAEVQALVLKEIEI